jgi:hypothetical protein
MSADETTDEVASDVGIVAPKGGGAMGLVIVVFAILIIGAIVSLPSMIIIVAGMIPTLVSRMSATGGDKRATLTMAAMSLGGITPVIGMVFDRGNTIETAMELLGEPLPLLMMLGAAGIAMAIHSALPTMAIFVMRKAAETRIVKLQKAQRILVQEWGDEVRGKHAKGKAEQSRENVGRGRPKANAGPGVARSASAPKSKPYSAPRKIART